MRKLDIGNYHRFTEINVMDEPGQGGACHEYSVIHKDKTLALEFASVSFQKGPVQEHGVNGCFQEDLIAICIDRLRSFQAGDFACRENALALTKLEEALHWLNHRTRDRQHRGVEGTNKQ
jgi:hypothetical protein